ncbi:MAG: DUF3972 domain-containing protein [Epsilonproteobacteria bacterium]|nr:MAG: DUF3972 domain-containing protein [Campylobacterota bacterium]
MEKLMKPVEYAQELGISRQAVYAKIKRGMLTAKSIEGKLYIVIDKTTTKPDISPEDSKSKPQGTSSSKSNTSSAGTQAKNYQALLQAKDETISVLKGTVKDLKKSNKQISTTLKGEIDLIKDAFHEMRSLYMRQLEQKRPQEDAIDVEESIDHEEEKWIGLKTFFKQENISKEKQQNKWAKKLNKAYKNGDIRLKKINSKLKIASDTKYKDIIK